MRAAPPGKKSSPALHYGAAKAALAAYIRGLAAEAGTHGVRVNTVTPGNIASPGGDKARQIITGGPERRSPAMPHRCRSTGKATGDIAEAVAFLASDRSVWSIATELVIDGGQYQTN